MSRIIASIAVSTAILMSAAAYAQPVGTGPVGRSCADDLATYCAGVPHDSTKARDCLEANRVKVSPDCRRALDTTGGGRGMGRNRQGSQ